MFVPTYEDMRQAKVCYKYFKRGFHTNLLRKTSDHNRKTFSSHSRHNPLLKPQLSSIYLELMKVTYCYIYYLCLIYNLNA